MKIAKNSVVSINYTLKSDDGEILDSNEGGAPLAYIHGIGFLVPGLENALQDKESGFKGSVKVAPRDGYGERRLELLQKIPRSQFQDVDNIEVGMQFETEGEHGPVIITVSEINDDTIGVDGNHPLAGMNLNFDIEVVSVREATQEELDHGHAHGVGGHHH